SIVYHYSLRPFSSTDPATYEIYTLSLHDALPILGDFASGGSFGVGTVNGVLVDGNGEVGANGARSSFFRVGGTHQLTVLGDGVLDRKSTRLNSSHVKISYAVFCLKKKKIKIKKNK